jgi:hypothetical protein
MDDEEFEAGADWLFRGDDRTWHVWTNGVHRTWNAITDDFGNLVIPCLIGDHAFGEG